VLIQGTFGILDRRLAIVGVMFALLIVTGTLMFNRYLGLSLLDALYFVVVTVATVGYGDINLLEASPPLKVFGIGMIMFGALTFALAFGLVTDAIVGARLLRALGQSPRRHSIYSSISTSTDPAARAEPPDPEAQDDERDPENDGVGADQPGQGEEPRPGQDRQDHPEEHR
jgi:hypothetical protein